MTYHSNDLHMWSKFRKGKNLGMKKHLLEMNKAAKINEKHTFGTFSIGLIPKVTNEKIPLKRKIN